MAMNIAPESNPQQRPLPSPRSPNVRARPIFLNDLNAPPTRPDSIDDNTEVPGYDNSSSIGSIPFSRRRRTTRNTLSIIQKELEEAKREIEAKVNACQNGDNISNTDKQSNEKKFNIRTSETEPKEPFRHQQDDGSRPASKSEKVYARYVQEGDRNLMLIYEPKETKSEIYVKQIGNKNVMVHLNISSNVCQLIDTANKGVIPLDSEGEVWLEIKRRSQLKKEADVQTDEASIANSVFENCSLRNGLIKRENEYVSSFSPKCSYVEGKVGRRHPAEHDDVAEENEDDGPYEPYETICVKERGNSLMIKFEKWNHHGVLKPENLKESPILSHEKVLKFLENEGNNFEMNICDWEYEKEQSVYSYISSNFKQAEGRESNDPYDKIITERPLIVHAREPEEHGASTLGDYDSPIADGSGPEEIYSRVNKVKSFGSQSNSTVNVSIKRSVSDPAKPCPENHVKDSKLSSRTSDPENYTQNAPDVPYRPPKPFPKPDDLSKHKWYHGNIEKHVAKERLRGEEHGSFLVRDSSSSKESAHQYTIEFIDGNAVKKLMIMKTNNKFHFYEYEDKKFDLVEHLINTIMTSGLEVKDSRSAWKNIKVKPVPHP